MVRDLGDWREAWPDGIETASDLPWTFIDAWSFASRIMSWYENLDDDEMPPRRIWQDQRMLAKHFEQLKAKRKAKYGGEEEAPEGTMADHLEGKKVTLRNQYLTEIKSAHDLMTELYGDDPLLG